MAKIYVFTSDGIDDIILKIGKEIENGIKERINDVYTITNEQAKQGKIPVKVGFENLVLYPGVFCNKKHITPEQIDCLENLNQQIIRKLDYIFRKYEKLSCTYNALKKYLPSLSAAETDKMENVLQEIISKSTAQYLLKTELKEDLKHIFQLLKLIEQHSNREKISIGIYDFELTELEYRTLHLVYRCSLAIKEWQNEKLTIYMGRATSPKMELFSDEQFELIRRKIKEFEIQAKKFHTSELVSIVLDADKTGNWNDALLKNITFAIS